MTATKNEELTVYVASFTTSREYSMFEDIFDSFGGKFSVKKEGDSEFAIYSDQIGKDLFEVMLTHSSIVFMI